MSSVLLEQIHQSYTQLMQPEVLRKIIIKYLNVTTCSSPIIDHKIEQAMDLVKNHLMNTWRAEVEILRSRIVELTERIQQLELENNFLRANATPEVLNALYEQQQQQQQLILQKTKDEIASDED
ncbi:protein bunched, class 1/class 3/D/E isoforms-like isoform X2 [Onthophagus taurus]|uniref:protein bunched, class 1/class 3/D/E isoforms-like isoform X2 n=1 Tax=Onthophagus taurus TaxID=166361 RepID=UPI000C20C3C6|nr:protein bunched, class 1/class 3/D/E isoforms-like isoform X2 [Onthophagus taurus]